MSCTDHSTGSARARRFRGLALLPLCGISLAIGLTPTARASQLDDPEPAATGPVVQSTGSEAGQALNAALSRLAREPRNPDALADAGDAALALGDSAAAIGFYTRADEIGPANGRIKAQIGRAQLRGDDPVGALRWFDAAERAGADAGSMALDRGLAFDLVGDNISAQRQYQIAGARKSEAEATRRYALSLAISGDRAQADQVLAPLLQQQDRASWRVRTFILAITGNTDEAVSVANASMPPELAAGIAPYLRFMPRLSPAQQAAAANLGRFPRAADIGRDDIRVVQYAVLHPRPAKPALITLAVAPSAPTHPVPDARGNRGKNHRNGREVAAPVVVASAASNPPAAVLLPPPPPPPQRLPATQPSAAQAATPVRSTFDLAQAPASTSVPVVQPTSTSAPSPAPAPATRPVVLARIDMPPPGQRSPVLATTKPSLSGATPPSQSQPMVQPVPSVANAEAPAVTPPQAKVEATAVVPTSTQVAAKPEVSAPAPLPENDFHALFEGFQAPAEEQQQSVAAVDLATLDARRTRAGDRRSSAANPAPAPTAVAVATTQAKGSKAAKGHDSAVADSDAAALNPGCKAGKAGASKQVRGKVTRSRRAAPLDDTCVTLAKSDGRDERPDGPTMVSRTTARDPQGDVKILRRGSEDKDQPTDEAKAGKDKAGKDKTGKGAKDQNAKDAKDKSAKEIKDAKAAKDAKLAKDKEARTALRHPSRIWLQVLTGGDRDKMAGEWKGLVRQARALKGHKPFITTWRSNFRLLTGPFDSDAEAQDFLASLRKDGVSGFQWTSPAGQVVDALPLK